LLRLVVERSIEPVAEIVHRHGAKRADGRQRACLGAAERVVVAVIVDVLSFEATRQADVLHEHVARVNALPIAWIGASTAASAQVTGVVVAIAWIVAPSGIVAKLATVHPLETRKRGPPRGGESREGKDPISRGQIGDNLAPFRVVGGCPPTTSHPIDTGLVAVRGGLAMSGS
jgi:hypothetical protein